MDSRSPRRAGYFHKGRRPALRCYVDWTQPITRDLLHAVVNYEGGGGTSRDLVNRRPWTHNNAPTWKPYAGIDFPAAGTAFIDTAIADTDYLGPVSIFWRGVIRTGSAFRHFAGKHGGGGATANPFDFRTTNDPSPRTRLVTANTGVRDWQGQLVTLNAVKSYALNRPVPIETTPREFIDGVGANMTLQAGAGTGNPTGTGANIRVGRRADGGVQMDGTMECIYIWKRLLSDVEHAELGRNPYFFLVPEDALSPWTFDFPPAPLAGPPAAALPTCGHPLHSGPACVPWYLEKEEKSLVNK